MQYVNCKSLHFKAAGCICKRWACAMLFHLFSSLWVMLHQNRHMSCLDTCKAIEQSEAHVKPYLGEHELIESSDLSNSAQTVAKTIKAVACVWSDFIRLLSTSSSEDSTSSRKPGEGEKCEEQLRVYTFCSYTFTGTFCVTLCQITWWLEYEIDLEQSVSHISAKFFHVKPKSLAGDWSLSELLPDCRMLIWHEKLGVNPSSQREDKSRTSNNTSQMVSLLQLTNIPGKLDLKSICTRHSCPHCGHVPIMLILRQMRHGELVWTGPALSARGSPQF